MKNSKYTSWDQSSDLPICSHSTLTTVLPRSSLYIYIYKKVKWSRYRPGVAQRVGRGIALLFHDRGNRREWVVSSTPWPHFTPGKDPVRILQEAGWDPEPFWTGGKSRPHRDSIPYLPARSQSLYRLSYPAYIHTHTHTHTNVRPSGKSLKNFVALQWVEFGQPWT